MLNRRVFVTGLTAAGTAAFHRPARAANRVMRWANASGFASPQLANDTVGMHPKLGFYQQEGIELQLLNMQGSATTIQNVIAGNCEVASLSPVSYLPLIVENPKVDLTVPYVWLRPIHTQIFVAPNTPFQKIADLKGKTIGFVNQADTAYRMARQMFTELHIDPDQDVSWLPVGQGVPAGRALASGQIDGYAAADTVAATLENSKFAFRGLANIGLVSKLFGLGWGTRRSALKENRKAYVGLFRAMTKTTIFTYTNPERAIQLHFELYPESVPKGIPLEQAVRDAQHILQARRDKWLPAKPSQGDPRFGGQTVQDWRDWAQFTGLSLPDPSVVYNTDLLDEVNDFDHDAIRRMAKQV